MSEVIVIAGKGGTGKTTISAALTTMLSTVKTGSVLAVDADPNSNLSEALGVESPNSISDIIDEVAKSPDAIPAGMGKDSFIEYRIHQDIVETEGFDLLVMGKPEGPGCYCYINNVLRNIMNKLILDYSYVIIDNEAGMEHFSRKTTRVCQKLIVVSDESKVGLKSAHRIFDLVKILGIEASKKYLIVNKTGDGQDLQFLTGRWGIDGVFYVPYDKELLALSSKGVPLKNFWRDSMALSAVEKIGDVIWPKS